MGLSISDTLNAHPVLAIMSSISTSSANSISVRPVFASTLNTP